MWAGQRAGAGQPTTWARTAGQRMRGLPQDLRQAELHWSRPTGPVRCPAGEGGTADRAGIPCACHSRRASRPGARGRFRSCERAKQGRQGKWSRRQEYGPRWAPSRAGRSRPSRQSWGCHVREHPRPGNLRPGEAPNHASQKQPNDQAQALTDRPRPAGRLRSRHNQERPRPRAPQPEEAPSHASREQRSGQAQALTNRPNPPRRLRSRHAWARPRAGSPQPDAPDRAAPDQQNGQPPSPTAQPHPPSRGRSRPPRRGQAPPLTQCQGQAAGGPGGRG
ncbi:hypothetical protein P3T35_000733 [Kitasatospora sp. GP30]|nr:hypothetical protein [Kitasatospora sp. GP30]